MCYQLIAVDNLPLMHNIVPVPPRNVVLPSIPITHPFGRRFLRERLIEWVAIEGFSYLFGRHLSSLASMDPVTHNPVTDNLCNAPAFSLVTLGD